MNCCLSYDVVTCNEDRDVSTAGRLVMRDLIKHDAPLGLVVFQQL